MMIMWMETIVLVPEVKVMFSSIIFFSLTVHDFLLSPWLAKDHRHKGKERQQLFRQDFVCQAVESISLLDMSSSSPPQPQNWLENPLSFRK